MRIRLWWNKRQALHFVNQILIMNGHRSYPDLPCGTVGSDTENPVTLALHRISDCKTISKPERVEFDKPVAIWRPRTSDSSQYARAYRIPLPYAVSRFLMDFDNWRYPELIEGGFVPPARMHH